MKYPLFEGDLIITTKGESTGLMYCGEVEDGRKERSVNLRCRCGKWFVTRLGNVRQGRVKGCPTCARKLSAAPRKWIYKEGDQLISKKGYSLWWTYLREVKSVNGCRWVRGKCMKCGHEQTLDLHYVLCTTGKRGGTCLNCDGKGIQNESI
jgi:hypothetical protein